MTIDPPQKVIDLCRAITTRGTSYLDSVGIMLTPDELDFVFRAVGAAYMRELSAQRELAGLDTQGAQ